MTSTFVLNCYAKRHFETFLKKIKYLQKNFVSFFQVLESEVEKLI